MANETHDMDRLVAQYLGDGSAEAEFDSIMAKYRRKRLLGASAACVAGLAVVIGVAYATPVASDADALPTTAEVMETLSAFTENDMDEITSIDAEPQAGGIMLTAQYEGGETCTYLVRRAPDGASIELIAQNINH